MQENLEISKYKLELRDKIPEVAMKLFAEQGIKNVRMDDVAHMMGISKRTIYELYHKKEDLLYEVIVKRFKEREEMMEVIAHRCKTVMEILLEVYRIRVEEFKNTNPLFYADMGRYPQVLEFLTDQNKRVRGKSLAFIQRGIDEGYFRSDLNYNLTGMLFDAMGQYVMEKELYRQYTIEEIFKSFVFVSLRGICTEKGIKAIEKLIPQV